MAFGTMKTSLVMFLALIFSASQLCACVAPMSDAPISDAPSSHEHGAHLAANADASAHDHGAHQQHDGEHERPDSQTGCAHCIVPSLLKSTLTVDLAATLSHPDAQKFITVIAASAIDGVDQYLLRVTRGHAWLDPPPTTPVTLKTRLLN